MTTNLYTEEVPIKLDSFNGINIYKIPSTKFKTNSINIFFHDNLIWETVSKNSLIPAVLRRGTKDFPTSKEISTYLEELYGASFDCGVSKKGEQQIIQFYIETIADRFASEDSNLLIKAFDLIFRIITDPVTEDGCFKKEYVAQEKENLTMLIQSRVNNKFSYAIERCFEEMCKNEPFGIYDYGSVEGLKKIEAAELYDHYLRFLEDLPISVYISGHIEDKDIEYIINKLSKLKRGNVKHVEKTKVENGVTEVRNVTESMNVSQGKLSLGFRTNTHPDSEEYYSLMVYNSILGGGVHSKLFANVREKAGLAYYAFSRLEKFKGLMIIGSGIEIKNKDMAMEIILKQMGEIKDGNISDYEFQASIKSMETAINSIKDNQLQIVDFYLTQQILASDENLDSLIKKIKQVKVEDVINISNRIKLDTVYFLNQN